MAAGLQDVRVDTVTQDTEFRSGEHLWDWIVNSNPLGRCWSPTSRAHRRRRVATRWTHAPRARRWARDGLLDDPNHIGVGTV